MFLLLGVVQQGCFPTVTEYYGCKTISFSANQQTAAVSDCFFKHLKSLTESHSDLNFCIYLAFPMITDENT